MTSITRRGFVKAAALAPVALSSLAETPMQAAAQQTPRPAGPAEQFDYVFGVDVELRSYPKSHIAPP